MSEGFATGRYPLPALEGDRVAWTQRSRSGEGTFVLCWLGIEEVWDVRLDDGETVHIYPGLGETMVKVEAAHVHGR